jgi:23S rRNA pseudouridine1911/1915/1917 synthase
MAAETMEELVFDVTEATELRVDKWICAQGALAGVITTRSALQRLFERGFVSVNGANVAKSHLLKTGDRVSILVPPPEPLVLSPESIPIDIIYEDDALLVVDKPKGMVVHPSAGHGGGTLVNALLGRCEGRLSSINGVVRPGIVHRIDKDTSGLLVVAKTDEAHLGLAEQIKSHTFTREYHAVVCGRFDVREGFVDAPVGRHKTDRKKMCVTESGKSAKTEYIVLEEYAGFSLVQLRLFTGRTHQIRVHMAYIGHPVVGDGVYGKRSPLCEGQCLHAKKIGFIHPVTGAYLEFDSDLPEYFLSVLTGIGAT